MDIYDTAQPDVDPVAIPPAEVTLASLPSEAYVAGHMTADGHYIAAITDLYEVDDGNALKVIDVSGATPVVTSFPTPEEEFDEPIQVAIDADAMQVAAAWGNYIYVFDINAPADPPLAFKFNLGSELGDFHAQSPVQMQFQEGYVLYRADAEGTVALLNTMEPGGAVTNLGYDAEAITTPVAMNKTGFGYFPASEEVDQIYSGGTATRSAIGTLDDPAALKLADQLDTIEVTDECLAGRQQGKYGYGAKMAITNDGARWFISGEGAVDEDIEFLQMATGPTEDFTLFEDADGDTKTGYVMASDVSVSSNTVAFWALRQAPGDGCFTDDEWVVGFIVLDRLD